LLATLLFTDMVGSTELAAKVGDRGWRRIAAAHHAAVRRDLKRFGGREIDTAGDGFFATFDQPSQAIRCAEAIVHDVRKLGIEVRAGLHMGEVEIDGPDVRGIAVHIGARVMSKAGPSQILVSSTVRDLMSGSDLHFDDLGTYELKGVPAQWRLYAVEQPEMTSAADATGPAVPAEEQPGRRIPLFAVIVVAAVVAAAVTVPIVLTRGGGSGGSGTVAVNTVARLDTDGRVQTAVPVGRDPLAAAADGGRIWLSNFNDGTIQAVDTSTNTASPAVALAVSAAPHAITVGGGFVWVLSSTNTGQCSVSTRSRHTAPWPSRSPSASRTWPLETAPCGSPATSTTRCCGSIRRTPTHGRRCAWRTAPGRRGSWSAAAPSGSPRA
jgi:hypothetical protein